MYATLVPTAREMEAEETANWEYGEDAKGLPPDLRRAGITRGAFSAALFAVADNVSNFCFGGGEQCRLYQPNEILFIKATLSGQYMPWAFVL